MRLLLTIITDLNKDCGPFNSFMLTFSKSAESLIIEYELKSKLHEKLDPKQFGFIPGSKRLFR